MKRLNTITMLFVGFAAACTSTSAQLLPPPGAVPNEPPVARANDSAPERKDMLLQPAAIASVGNASTGPSEQLPPGNNGVLSLEELEQMATANNPSIAQAHARVMALRGRQLQVGLAPNPQAGYLANEIGDEGRAGQQGGYVSQEFVTGGKLGLNRAVVSQEIQQAEQIMQARQLRVLTDVRLAYYAALVAVRREDLAKELLQIGERTSAESLRLKTAGEISKTEFLPIEIEQRNAQILLKIAGTERTAAWRRLSYVVGVELPTVELAGDISKLPSALTYDEQLAHVLANSPEIAAAIAEMGRSQNALARAQREPIPNVFTQFSLQKDNATNDTITGVQVGIPLPFWDRNQGGIMEAQAQISQARRNVDRVELDLKNRLAAAFQRYSSAQERAKIYSDEIVPKAEENFKLVQGAYPAQVSSLEFLTAQRIFFQTKLAYLDSLAELWISWNQIQGLLLSDSLGTPLQ